jgi:NAD(P)-dependent dehydrogenase (short-subunit alcohol dehydrogenase family)
MTNPFSYEGKHIVVTGGARGIGDALLKRLAEMGSKDVTVLDVELPTGPHTNFIRTDLADPSAVEAAIIQTGRPINVLFNNAGVSDMSQRETVFAVNFLALRRLIELVSPQMPPGSAIVNTASTAGSQWRVRMPKLLELFEIHDWAASANWFAAQRDIGVEPYGFTKEAVILYTMWASRDLASRLIRMNAVVPGPVDTPLLPDFRATMGARVIDWSISQGDGRIVEADDVACVLTFLGSDAARSISGGILPVDRGFLAALETGHLDFGGLSGPVHR